MIRALSLVATIVLFLSSCSSFTLEVNAQIEPDPILNIESEQVLFSIYSYADSTNVRGMADFLRSHAFIFASDSIMNSPHHYRVLIGETGLPESNHAIAEINGSGYIIKQSGKDLIINGSDDTWVAMGLYMLEDYLLSSGKQTTSGHWIIPNYLTIKEDYSNPQLIARLIQKKYNFTLDLVYLFNCRGVGSCTIGQGATSDGYYLYVLNKNASDNQCIIFRYDPKTLQLKGQSPVFSAGHANDMAYLPDSDLIIISHGLKEGRVLTLVNASDLSVKSDINISVGSSSIAYSDLRKQFALSQGGTTLHITDCNFNVIDSFSRKQSDGYTTQGMGCDDSFIYFPVSSSKDNVIDVFSWEGEYIRSLTLATTKESESLFYAAGNYYVNFNSSGSSLYKIIPKLRYHYTGLEHN